MKPAREMRMELAMSYLRSHPGDYYARYSNAMLLAGDLTDDKTKTPLNGLINQLRNRVEIKYQRPLFTLQKLSLMSANLKSYLLTPTGDANGMKRVTLLELQQDLDSFMQQVDMLICRNFLEI